MQHSHNERAGEGDGGWRRAGSRLVHVVCPMELSIDAYSAEQRETQVRLT
jgi:hypothetical protein